MPYVPPASCPQIAQAPATVLALYAVIMRRVVADMEFAAELMEGGPDYYQFVKEEVDQRTREHDVLVALFMRPVFRIYGALDA